MLSFDSKLIISCVTKNKGPLTKIMSLDAATGQVIKDGSECSMSSGTIKQIPISSPDGFAKMLSSRKSNQAIVHGLCEYQEAKVVTKTVADKAKSAPSSDNPVIARTKDYITYSNGSGIILFDHDKSRPGSVGSAAALTAYHPGELVAILSTVHPAIGDAAFVSTPSTSSCIYNTAGEVLRGEGTGSHTYLFVRKASDIPRYLKTLGKRLFLVGLGRIEISRSGSLLERTLVDLMVGSPERLDFVAGAVCRDGLVQKLPPPAVHDGGMLDTETLLELTVAEEKQYQSILADLKNQAKPEQERVVSEYVEREVGKLVSGGGITSDEARQIITSRRDHILEDSDILFFNRQGAGVSVASVLDNGKEYHKKSLADPLEPDYEGGSKTKAQFYWNDGNPYINSFAHGSGKYRFRRFVKVEVAGGVSSVSSPDDNLAALYELNKKYAAVLLGGDFRIVKEGFDKKEKKHTISFLRKDAFCSYYSNRRVWVDNGKSSNGSSKKEVELSKLWINWDQRRTYNSVTFDPSCTSDPKAYNMFRGFPLQPKPGDWSLMRELMLDIICDGNQEHYDYLLAWMARTVQKPGGKRPGVAIVMGGGKGIGKGAFAEYFGKIFGEAFLAISKAENITGKFNMHLSKSVVVFLDEAVWGGNKPSEGTLKQIITEPRLLFEPKGVDSFALGNYVNLIIAGNEPWMIPATGDERRFFVLTPNEKHKQDTVYFGKISDECDSGGAEALMHFLLQHDYSGINLRKAPKTEGLGEQVSHSLPSVLSFWQDILIRGYLLTGEGGAPTRTKIAMGGIDAAWPEQVFKYEVYGEYSKWCKNKNERYIEHQAAFWKKTWSVWPGGGKGKEMQLTCNEGRLLSIFTQTLVEHQQAFTQKTTIPFDKVSENDEAPF